ncbi:PREDICTED: uncharacterized protein LOC108374767 isoform X2 [Rhagoletis zephyria]|nr:PREDICTED: uncharacterized protein LOC108374767 isoform X2 [Rhagoletis zephyria]
MQSSLGELARKLSLPGEGCPKKTEVEVRAVNIKASHPSARTLTGSLQRKYRSCPMCLKREELLRQSRRFPRSKTKTKRLSAQILVPSMTTPPHRHSDLVYLANRKPRKFGKSLTISWKSSRTQ